MNTVGNTWAIVLAAGEGSRLHSLTTTTSGVAVPKQFCSLRGGSSLLREALQRAEAVASPAHICVVVAHQHKLWWGPTLAAVPESNVIVQPSNRGTANGILWPLLHIMARDPKARIVLLPSDHHVGNESILANALQTAAKEIEAEPNQVLLLGLSPEEADPDLGYIVPGHPVGTEVSTITQFVEKPTAAVAQGLIDSGALWNGFFVAAPARTLLQMFTTRFPQIVTAMQAVIEQGQYSLETRDAANELYRTLPTIDFSRQVLQDGESALRVLRVQPCGWSDLGTPKRLAETLRRLPPSDDVKSHSRSPLAGFLDLAIQHANQQTIGIAQ